MKRFLLILMLLPLLQIINAQGSEIGIGYGYSTYFGDLNAPSLTTNLSQSHPAFQIFYNYYLNKRLNTRLALGYGVVSGDDSKSQMQWQRERNLSFQSTIIEFSGLAEYNIFGMENFINPFVYFGFNGFHFDPKTMYQGKWVRLQPLGTEGQGLDTYPDRKKYNLIGMSIVTGAGVKIRINNAFMISMEFGLRRTNTDYLDDVSTTYVNYYELYRGNGELAAKLSDRTNEYFGIDTPYDRPSGAQRGGDRVPDFYTMTFINIVYKLGEHIPLVKPKVHCPGF